jgi:hypothetical protein
MLFLGIFQHDQILKLFLYILLVNIIQHSTFLNEKQINNVFFNIAKVHHFAKLKKVLVKGSLVILVFRVQTINHTNTCSLW